MIVVKVQAVVLKSLETIKVVEKAEMTMNCVSLILENAELLTTF